MFELSALRQVAPLLHGTGENTQLAACSRGLFHGCKTFVMFMRLWLALISRIVLMRAEEDIEVKNILAFGTDHVEGKGCRFEVEILRNNFISISAVAR
jgi:hypothetical protein